MPRRFQFSLRTVLWPLLVVAAFFGGFAFAVLLLHDDGMEIEHRTDKDGHVEAILKFTDGSRWKKIHD